MTKAPSSGKSLLFSVLILFVFFTGIALVLSNGLIFSYLQSENTSSGSILLAVAILFLLLLIGILLVQVWRLFWAYRRREAAIQYKIKMIAFFSALVLMSALPSALLTTNILRKAFDAWFVQDTTNSLQFGLDMTLEYYQHRIDSFRLFTNSDLVGSLLRNYLRNPQDGFERIHETNSVVDTLQVFTASGEQFAASGNAEGFLDWEEVKILEPGNFMRSQKGNLVNVYLYNSDQYGSLYCVFQALMPQDFNSKARVLSLTEKKLQEYRDFGLSFPMILFGVYLLFLVPLVILAILMSLYIADMLVAPLAQLDEAVRRVSEGDFTTRLLVKNSDVLSPFISSFNRMVEEMEGSRLVSIQSERIQTWQDIAQRLAHEIKNPLTPIQLAAERIQRKYTAKTEGFETVMAECVGIIVHEVDGLSKMLAEFRDFARLPAPNPERLALRDLLESTWALYKEASLVSFELSGISEDLYIRADKDQLHQVFKNLLKNALDAIGDKEGIIKAAAFIVEKGGRKLVRISLQDTGSGMKPEVLAQIFDPYFTNKIGGTGLGLAICEKIMLDHGGRIWAESTEGRGSTFYLDLRYEEDGIKTV